MITIDTTSRTFQAMDGFGASITDSSARLLTQLHPRRSLVYTPGPA